MNMKCLSETRVVQPNHHATYVCATCVVYIALSWQRMLTSDNADESRQARAERDLSIFQAANSGEETVHLRQRRSQPYSTLQTRRTTYTLAHTALINGVARL